jgi:threonine dehydrogenase-like Zn-dependent dehydrogenase
LVRAAVLAEFEQPIQVQEFPRPAALESGAALVRVELAGVCGTDAHLWHGRLPVPRPFILGHEAVGTLVALGAEVRTDSAGQPVQEGDRVMWLPGVACGHCFFCLQQQDTKCQNRRVYGVRFSCAEPPHLFGDFAEEVYLVPGTRFFRVPKALPSDALIAFGCAGPTMVHGYERLGGIQVGESVAVQGAGPVGLFATLLAKESGARQTIVLGAPRQRLEVARQLGADHVIDLDTVPSPAERVRRVLELTEGRGPDIVIEAAGVPAAVQEGWQMVRDAGRYLEVGQYTDRGTVPLNPHEITRKHLTILGSWGQMARHLARYIRLLEQFQARHNLGALVTHRFSLAETDQALRTVEQWQAVKAAVVPS